MTGWRLAAILAGCTNEALAAFLRGLEVRGFKEAVASYSKSRVDGPEESGLVASAVDLFGTAARLSQHLQDVALASLENTSPEAAPPKPPSP